MADYGLITPCAQCPFRTDVKPYITAARVKEILNSSGEFHCHKTIEVGETIDDEETWCEVTNDKNAQVCAGFLILLENDGSPNQMMRIAERIRLYDPSKLRMDAPVYKSVRAAIAAHRRKSTALSSTDSNTPAINVSEKEAEVSTLKVGEQSDLTKAGIATIDRAYRWPQR